MNEDVGTVRPMVALGRWGKWALIVVVGLVIAIQFVPYGRDHVNPGVVVEPAWDSPATRELAVRACYDCHSNETVWPWYSNVAPVSWLVQQHVTEGREELNFSEWRRSQEGDEAAETILEGSMPLRSYLLTHPSARLNAVELGALVDGLDATFGAHGGRASR
jgi:hypothetical protein